MKWAFAIQRKIRLAIFMASMMLVIILFTLVESYNITKISKSFNSIYEDRLIPASDLHQIGASINERNQRLVLYLFSETISNNDLKIYVDTTDKYLNRLLSKYESTYLVKEEKIHLSRLKTRLADFQRDEKLLVEAGFNNKSEAGKLYLTKTLPLFNQLSGELLELTKMQTLVGKKLLGDSIHIASESNLITNLQLVIGIILGLMIIVLVLTSKEMIFKSNNFNMN